MPRKPGSLVRAKCCLCGAVELASGAGNFSRCTPCKAAGLRARSNRSRYDATGKEDAGSEVQRAIREGRLTRASEHQCVDCGKQACDYDHRDYNQPLAVQPVCRSCNLKRGPAIPAADWLTRSRQYGSAPYRQKSCVVKVLSMLGRSASALDGFPARLTEEDWRRILPALIGTEGAPAVPEPEARAA